MKTISLVVLFFFSSSTVFALETIDGKPSKPYSVISPISSDKGSVDKAFKKLQQKAESLGADALIDWNCEAGQKIRTGLLQLKTLGSSAICEGVAIKWK